MDSFPRQYARTQRLTLGEPRNITVSSDGATVYFLRSDNGSDHVNRLWRLDVDTGVETLLADPPSLLSGGEEELPPEERARRERAREGAGGIVAYAVDAAVTIASFALGGRLFVTDLATGSSRELVVPGPVFDPRPDPTGTRIAYVRGAELLVTTLTGETSVLAAESSETITWGSADFVAAEEMGRQRGYWWAPDASAIVACRVDTAAVPTWWIGDPAQPSREPVPHRYPAAGTTNPDVQLFVCPLDGPKRQIRWDAAQFPYLPRVVWSRAGFVIAVQSRDQRTLQVLDVDLDTGTTAERWTDTDEQWVELVAGTPALFGDGRLVTAADRDGARRLLIEGVAVTPPELQVRSVQGINSDSVWFTANPIDDATVLHVWRWDDDGLTAVADDAGVHGVTVGGPTAVIRSATLGAPHPVTRILGGPTIAGHAETPLVDPNVRLFHLGPRRLATAVLLPHDCPAEAKLPVLMDPYGGPHAQRVLSSRAAFFASQWLADQGFAVVIVDNRGTPGRGSAFERAVHLDLATPVLDDQIEALHAAAELVPQLDLTRVGIRGWSFGGYLAALAVLRRPDVFHAAVAGAPVTEWRLYDTHYTERYLGHPDDHAAAYDATSLLPLAVRLERPLLLIHGLADDNVLAAHTLQLSSALLAAGKPHEVLPLSGVTHMTPQEVVAENLLRLQVAFLQRALAC
jgi:dipeptidyl-peptidase-4